jgi:hypothetical protein
VKSTQAVHWMNCPCTARTISYLTGSTGNLFILGPVTATPCISAALHLSPIPHPRSCYQLDKLDPAPTTQAASPAPDHYYSSCLSSSWLLRACLPAPLSVVHPPACSGDVVHGVAEAALHRQAAGQVSFAVEPHHSTCLLSATAPAASQPAAHLLEERLQLRLSALELALAPVLQRVQVVCGRAGDRGCWRPRMARGEPAQSCSAWGHASRAVSGGKRWQYPTQGRQAGRQAGRRAGRQAGGRAGGRAAATHPASGWPTPWRP